MKTIIQDIDSVKGKIKSINKKYVSLGDGTYAEVVSTVTSTEATNGQNIATKSNLVAGKSPTGKQVPVKVTKDGKLDLAGTPISINGNP